MGRFIERMFFPLVMISFVALLLTGYSAHKQHSLVLNGAGATFPAPLYSRWIALFEREHPHLRIQYHAIGSGGGIRAISSRSAHFGASDALLNDNELRALSGKLLQVPMVLGPVVMAYNVPGLERNLILTGEIIADIYLKKITRWNDTRLQQLNPGLSLPDLAIRVTHRKDSSGTTSIFTNYLSSVSSEWSEKVGKGKKVNWPTSFGAGEGNDGIAHQILLQSGGIGYLEYKYAENAGLSYAAIVNRAGKTVLPTVEGVQAAERNTPATADSILKQSIVNAPGEKSYPIAGFTYLLMYDDLHYFENTALAEALISYLKWTLDAGQEIAPQLHYAPLPEELRQKALQMVDTIAVAPKAAATAGH